MEWIVKTFHELTTAGLYDLLTLRSNVFVVEQQCVFLDMDYKDQQSVHLMGYKDSRLVAYSRLLPAGLSYTEMSIGRVVTAPEQRRSGLGKELMAQSVNHIRQLYGTGPIRIGAQLYLQRFYEDFNFKVVSDMYMEDGIPHIEMIRM